MAESYGPIALTHLLRASWHTNLHALEHVSLDLLKVDAASLVALSLASSDLFSL